MATVAEQVLDEIKKIRERLDKLEPKIEAMEKIIKAAGEEEGWE